MDVDVRTGVSVIWHTHDMFMGRRSIHFSFYTGRFRWPLRAFLFVAGSACGTRATLRRDERPSLTPSKPL